MEKWEEFYTDDQIRRIQEIELENLRVFIDVCEKLNLEYFVYGGTLLGVEKYKGMIPWDDDIDVALPRESYQEFISKAHTVLPEGYFVQSPYNCKKSPYPYTKLRKKGTKYVESINRNLDIETGIYIDIYPVDRIPDDDRLRKKQFKKVRRWILIYVYRQSRLYDKKEITATGLLKNIVKWVLCNVAKVYSQAYCLRRIDYYMTMYNNTQAKRYAALNSPNYENIYLNLFPLEKGELNGIEVCIPGDYKTHLKMRYGDYHQLPPEDQRVGHIPYILDLGEEAT